MPSLDFLENINNKEKNKENSLFIFFPRNQNFKGTFEGDLGVFLVYFWWIWKDQGVFSKFETRFGSKSHFKGN